MSDEEKILVIVVVSFFAGMALNEYSNTLRYRVYLENRIEELEEEKRQRTQPQLNVVK